jgi:hypothetical protein
MVEREGLEPAESLSRISNLLIPLVPWNSCPLHSLRLCKFIKINH